MDGRVYGEVCVAMFPIVGAHVCKKASHDSGRGPSCIVEGYAGKN